MYTTGVDFSVSLGMLANTHVRAGISDPVFVAATWHLRDDDDDDGLPLASDSWANFGR